VRFISDSVLAGFTSASAVLISASQLKHLLGMHIPRYPDLPSTLYYVVTHLRSEAPVRSGSNSSGTSGTSGGGGHSNDGGGGGGVQIAALLTGIGGVLVLVGIQKFNKRFCKTVTLPEQLILLVLATLISWLAQLPKEQLPVVGVVPPGLPSPSAAVLGRWSLPMLLRLLQPAMVVAVVSFILSMSIVRIFALKFEYTTDPGQELLALGCANIIGAFFQSYPVAGSLSRSAIVAATCGKHCTPMHGVFTALFVALVLLLLTGAFRPMPKAILASVVFVAVKGLFDMAKPRFLYRVSTGDFVAWLASFLGTLLIGVPEGIAVGVFTSMALIILRMAHPNYAMLGRLPGTMIATDDLPYMHACKLCDARPAARYDDCH
jgi:sulfate permease, SulP family